jgi:hypothetical protein
MPGQIDFKKLFASPEPPELGPGPRAGVQSEAAVKQEVDKVIQEAGFSQETGQLMRALALLWHDHLDAAHTIAQGIENADGSFVHAIMHRREPDYSNAGYWFRRVGKHRAFPEIARRVAALGEAEGANSLLRALVPKGVWDPFAFVDACAQAEGAGRTKENMLLRDVQRVEFHSLMDCFAEGK